MSSVAKDLGGSIEKENVQEAVKDYEKYHALHGGSSEARKAHYADMVNKVYHSLVVQHPIYHESITYSTE